MKKIYLIWFIFIFGFYFTRSLIPVNLLNIYLTIGILLLIVCMILDRTIVSGNQTRANFFLDKYTKSDNHSKITTIILIFAIPFFAAPLIYYLIFR